MQYTLLLAALIFDNLPQEANTHKLVHTFPFVTPLNSLECAPHFASFF